MNALLIKKHIFFSLLYALTSSSPCFASSFEDCSDPIISKLVEKAKKEINDRSHLTLASTDRSGAPWNTPVYTAFDASYTFFWMSEQTSRHSQNIHRDSRTFAVLYDSTAPLGTGFGVHVQGDFHELHTSWEIRRHGIKLIAQRAGVPAPSEDDYQGRFPSRIYKFIPRRFWVNTLVDLDGKFVDRRIEITECMQDLRISYWQELEVNS